MEDRRRGARLIRIEKQSAKPKVRDKAGNTQRRGKKKGEGKQNCLHCVMRMRKKMIRGTVRTSVGKPDGASSGKEGVAQKKSREKEQKSEREVQGTPRSGLKRGIPR